ncbi:MAG: hypothetical protein LBB23_01190 [Rickettsiales bacterium]|nr:hypothetical protein [Rickettsiales bacterium]
MNDKKSKVNFSSRRAKSMIVGGKPAACISNTLRPRLPLILIDLSSALRLT